MANLLLMDIDGGGGGLLDSGSGGYSGSGGGSFVPPASVASVASSSSSSFDYDLSPASFAAARSRGNVESDVRSAYQTYVTGVPSGRGGQYAVDAQRRFGYGSIKDAAAAYLDAAGLRRLLIEDELTGESEIEFLGDFFELPFDPEPGPDTKGVVTQEAPEGPGNPFQTIGDLAGLFERFFAQREPETTAPVVVVGDSTQSEQKSGGGMGLVLLVLAIGAGAFYWFYWRKRNAE